MSLVIVLRRSITGLDSWGVPPGALPAELQLGWTQNFESVSLWCRHRQWHHLPCECSDYRYTSLKYRDKGRCLQLLK